MQKDLKRLQWKLYLFMNDHTYPPNFVNNWTYNVIYVEGGKGALFFESGSHVHAWTIHWNPYIEMFHDQNENYSYKS